MANRSTFGSKLPRNLKKLLALTPSKDAHEARQLRELFLEAHAHHKKARYQMQKPKVVANPGDSAD
jgi:hypothetical protein